MLNGYCPCCRQHVEFEISGKFFRSSYSCKNCNSKPRHRHLIHILDKLYPNWDQLLIHESSPGGGCSFDKFAKKYSFSQYLADTPSGLVDEKGVRSENLEALTFPDESFDIFITQDVFEHIFNPQKAIKEIARVLKPGGSHVFTAPKFAQYSLSFPMAEISQDGKIHHLVSTPEYHGNPVGDGKSLVTWRYGRDFEFLLCSWSGLPVTTYDTTNTYFGICAEYNEVFVMRKV